MLLTDFQNHWCGEALLDRLELPEESVTLIAAVSGGADSVLLLHALSDMMREFKDRDIQLIACHVNHGMRQDEADRDAQFVEELAGSLHIPFILKRGDALQLAAEDKRGMEAAARRLRYRAFSESLAEYGFLPESGIPEPDLLYTDSWRTSDGRSAFIILAHHGGDQAESLMLNIQRGTGLNGLTGMRPVQGVIRRPWLDLPGATVHQVIEELNIEYVSDSTNLQRIYARNRVRLDLLPLWDSIAGHSIEHKLVELSRRLKVDEDLLQELASQRMHDAIIGAWVFRIGTCGTVMEITHGSEEHQEGLNTSVLLSGHYWSASRFGECEEALQVRFLMQAIVETGSINDLESRHYELMISWLQSEKEGSLDLPAGLRVVKRGDEFFFSTERYVHLQEAVGCVVVAHMSEGTEQGLAKEQCQLILLTNSEDLPNRLLSVVASSGILYNVSHDTYIGGIDSDAISYYRTRRQGDTVPVALLQCPHNETDSLSREKRVGLKRFWQRYRIPEPLRDRVIFFTDDKGLIIAPASIGNIKQTLKQR